MLTKVTKLDAALAQLTTAIELYVTDGDKISIYTLVRASEEILDRICKKRGLERGAIFEGIESMTLTPERKKEIIDILNEPRNFFKHAENDHDAELEWGEGVVEHYISDCITMYKRVVSEDSIPCDLIAFSIIHRVSNPDLYKEVNNNSWKVNIDDTRAILDSRGIEFVYQNLKQICQNER